MEAVELSLPAIEITESDKKYQNSIWHWYETLASFGFSWPELQQFNRNALQASFLNDADKNLYREL